MELWTMNESNHCLNCDYAGSCEDAFMLNFCDECKYIEGCSCCTNTCKAGHYIECNNGFEPKSYLEEDIE